MRKQERAERAILYKELLSKKPDSSRNNPRDEAQIKQAEMTIGDYKLKTSDKYIVPESERVDADKKRRQIILLERSIYELKEQFNRHVLNIKLRKEKIIDTIKKKKEIMSFIDEELRSLDDYNEKNIVIPELDVEAYPEKRYEISDEDIISFKAKLEEDKKKQMQNDNDDDNGLGGFNATGPQQKNKEKDEKEKVKTEKKHSSSSNSSNTKNATSTSASTRGNSPQDELKIKKKKENDEWIKRRLTKLKYLIENNIQTYSFLETVNYDKIYMIELEKLLNNVEKSELEKEEILNYKAFLQYLREDIYEHIEKLTDDFDKTFNILFSEQVLLEGGNNNN